MPVIVISSDSEVLTVYGSSVVVGSGTLSDVDRSKIDNVPSDTNTELAAKVDTVAGKGLSTNDYDDTEKGKVTAAGTHAANTSNPHSVSKSDVGLSNVDNTTDSAKPVSTAQQAALDLKANTSDIPDVENTNYLGGWDASTNTPTISDATGSNAQFYIVDTAGTVDLGSGNVTFVEGGKAYHNGTVWQAKDPVDAVASVAGKTGVITLVSSDVGLGNVDNTSDANKPISTATQTALDLKLTTAGATTTLGLQNVDNTADADKPVSTAQAAADTAVQALIPTSTSGLTDTASKRLVTDAQILAWDAKLDQATVDGKADAISITGSHTETTTDIDFSSGQGYTITLTANRAYTVSGLTSTNPVGVLEITHAGFTPSFSGTTALNTLVDVNGTYFIKIQYWPSGAITSKSVKEPATVASSSEIQTVQKKLTSSEVLALNATPNILVSAQGADTLIRPIKAYAYLKYATTAYTTNTILQLSSQGTVYAICDILDATADRREEFIFTNPVVLSDPNNSLILDVQTGDPLAGDGELGIEVNYIVSDESGLSFSSLPVASSVSISGTEQVGNILTGSYTYSDADGDPESGSTFKWHRADDAGGTNDAAIAGATSINYTLQSADEGKYIRFAVTPVNATQTGLEVFSSYSGVIAAESAPPTSVTNINDWSSTNQVDNMSFPISVGTNRYLIVAVNHEGNDTNVGAGSVTYGGQSLVSLESVIAFGNWNHTELWGLDESGIQSASNTTITVSTYAGDTPSIAAAAFEGVNQITPVRDSGNWGLSGVNPTVTDLTINTNDMLVGSYATSNAAATTSWDDELSTPGSTFAENVADDPSEGAYKGYSGANTTTGIAGATGGELNRTAFSAVVLAFN